MAPDRTQVLVCLGFTLNPQILNPTPSLLAPANCMASQHRPLTQVCRGLQGSMGGALDASYRALSRGQARGCQQEDEDYAGHRGPPAGPAEPRAPAAYPRSPRWVLWSHQPRALMWGLLPWGVTIGPGSVGVWGGHSSPASSPAGTARGGRPVASVLQPLGGVCAEPVRFCGQQQLQEESIRSSRTCRLALVTSLQAWQQCERAADSWLSYATISHRPHCRGHHGPAAHYLFTGGQVVVCGCIFFASPPRLHYLAGIWWLCPCPCLRPKP